MEVEHKSVNITIDDQVYSVPANLNLIQAASYVGIEIPHFCYHPCLSVVGHCRMCQVEQDGASKLVLACHTKVQEGQIFRTHKTSEKVRKAQQAVLEFLLINHPLDCPTCDQAGHCKLQDYYMTYSKQNSRFAEDKEKNNQKVSFGSQISYVADRCIKCSRCIRFCEEITETHELAFINRGSNTEISCSEKDIQNNPFSGCLADLCPVGALTHRKWQLKSRAWQNKEVETFCLGCSRLCPCKVAVRDNQIVYVSSDNNELNCNKIHDIDNKNTSNFLCDEGRYGFSRFIPKKRLQGATFLGKNISIEDSITQFKVLGSKPLVVFFSPDLTFEDYKAWKKYLDKTTKVYVPVVSISSQIEKSESVGVGRLNNYIFNDKAGNVFAAAKAGLIPSDLKAASEKYRSTIEKLINGVYQHALFIGDRSLRNYHIDDGVIEALKKLEFNVAIMTNAQSVILPYIKLVIAGHSIYEKSGSLINHFGDELTIQSIFQSPINTISNLDYLNYIS